MRNFLRTTLLACILSLCLVAPGAAGPLEDGRVAYNLGDYATALRLYRPLAKQGHAKAQFELGRMYELGKGVPRDDAQARKWYLKAAEQRYAKAQFELGRIYLFGSGVMRDFVTAHMWFNLADTYGDFRGAWSRDNMVRRKMTSAQISEAYRLAREWKARVTPPRSKQPLPPSKIKPPQGFALSPPAEKNKPAPISARRWISLATLPPASKDKTALKPKEVFRLVSPSVWIVYAAHSVEAIKGIRGERAQGSAVAISTSRLVTNCHVVLKRRVVLIRQKGRFLNAKLISADAATDRCVLATGNGQVKPVPGIRAHSKLEVGERVCTVGAPRGLENTLGEGIISGLRKLDGVALVQTTAPISPCSSGGGLFDEFGNLIGITTLQIKESDALNFAIAASEYWR